MPDEPRFVPLAFERLPEEGQLARSQAFLARLRTRRTVRRFSREPVPYELVENAVAAAGTAPSGAHQQPWTFVVVSDADVKRRIRAAAEEEERRSYEGRMPREWLEAFAPLFLREILERPENERPYVVVPIGYPAERATMPDLVRKPLEAILVRR